MPLPSKEEIETALERETNKSILELTPAKIKQEKNDILQKLQLPRDRLKDFHRVLKNYRFIDKLHDVILGNFIRWINISNPQDIKIMNGGFVADFKETDTTIYIVCKTAFGRFFNVDINKCIIFQKLNDHEETLLAVINYLEK